MGIGTTAVVAAAADAWGDVERSSVVGAAVVMVGVRIGTPTTGGEVLIVAVS